MSFRTTHPKTFLALVIAIPIVVVVVSITVGVVLSRKKKKEPDEEPVEDFKVVFDTLPSNPLETFQDVIFSMSANKNIKTYPSITDFKPFEAVSVNKLSARSFSVVFNVKEEIMTTITLRAESVVAETDETNKTVVTNERINFITYPFELSFTRVENTNIPAFTNLPLEITANQTIQTLPRITDFEPMEAKSVTRKTARSFEVVFNVEEDKTTSFTLRANSSTSITGRKNLEDVVSQVFNFDSTIIPTKVPKPLKSATAVDRRDFYALMSTDGLRGRNNKGDLIDNNGTIIEAGVPATVEGLSAFPLNYAVGHPFWKETSFGYLKNGTWARYLSSYPLENSIASVFSRPEIINKSNVLVIEANVSGDKTYEFAPVIVDSNVDVEGIVVRKGGILLISPLCTSIKCQFILVESGGILQIGSHYNEEYKFEGNLEIMLTHPNEGFTKLGVVASQYSFNIYHPGATEVETDDDPKRISDYNNIQLLRNTFGPKVLAAGFNGTIEMATKIPEYKAYNGTWNAKKMDGNEFIGYKDMMTYLDESDPDSKSTAKLNALPQAYPCVWARLDDAIFDIGSFTIKLDPEDVGRWLIDWKKGDKIIITGRNPVQTTVKFDPWGQLPIHMDSDDPVSFDANVQATKSYQDQFLPAAGETNPPLKQYGFEKATIESVDIVSGVITLQKPLQFVHDSSHTTINRDLPDAPDDLTKTIKVQSCLHVGLLTRRVKITSLLNNGGSGFNRLKSQLPEIELGKWSGPRYYVQCNTNKVNASGSEIYSKCYENFPETNEKYCGNITNLDTEPLGVWHYDTVGLSGPNSLLGGHTMFRGGSSTWIDGVETTKMGTPGGFGTVARYAWHYHMAQSPTFFNGYLRPTGGSVYGVVPDVNSLDFRDQKMWRRLVTLQNGSAHQLFTRHVSCHGTNDVTVRNQVIFFNMGHQNMAEGGTEIFVNFDHMLSSCTMQCLYNKYTNPIPISGQIGSDFAYSSAFWLKSNSTNVSRNVTCGLSSGSVAFWQVPIRISALRDPTTLILGDPILGLPGSATYVNAENNLSPTLTTWDDVKDELKLENPCYNPTEFENLGLIYKDSKCNVMNTDNAFNPIGLQAENVVYQAMTLSNFPEYFQLAPVGYIPQTESFATTPNFAFNDPAKSLVGFQPRPQFQPFNSQFSNTDSPSASGSVYTEARWGGENPKGFPFQPISAEYLEAYETNGLTKSELIEGTMMPYVISGLLTYSTIAAGDLTPNFWSKQTPVYFISCCCLETSFRVREPDLTFNETTPGAQPPFASWSTLTNPDSTTNVLGEGNINGGNPVYYSVLQVSAGGNGNQSYGALFHAFVNCIFDGGFAIPSNSSIFGGEKSFLGDSVRLASSEYNTGKGSLNNLFCFDLPVDKAIDFFPAGFYKNRAYNLKTVSIFDRKNDQAWILESDEGLTASGTPGTGFKSDSYPVIAQTMPKIPYMFGVDNKLLRISTADVPESRIFNSTRPDWFDIAANAMLRSFITPKAIEYGDKIGLELSFIPMCMPPFDGTDGVTECCRKGDTCA